MATQRSACHNRLLGLPDTAAQTRKTTTLSLTLQTPKEYFDKGVTLIEQQHYAEAAETFFSATQLQWDLTTAHIELGNAYSALRQYEKSLTAYTNALENDPGSAITHYNIALTYLDLGQFDKALQWIDALIKLDPKYQIAYSLFAKLLLNTNRLEQALTQLLVAAKLSKPHHPDILVQAGRLSEQLNKTNRTLRCYRRALKSDPWHADAFYSLGLIQYNAGQINAANLSLANAVNTQPAFPEAHALLRKLKKELTPKQRRRSPKPTQALLFSAEATT